MEIIIVTYGSYCISFYSDLKPVDFVLLVSSETKYEEHCVAFQRLYVAKQRGKVVHFKHKKNSIKNIILGVLNSRTDLNSICRMLTLNFPASKTTRNNIIIQTKLQEVTSTLSDVLHLLSGVQTQAPNNHSATQWAGWWPPFCIVMNVCLSKGWPYLTSIREFSHFSLDQITVHQKLQV